MANSAQEITTDPHHEVRIVSATTATRSATLHATVEAEEVPDHDLVTVTVVLQEVEAMAEEGDQGRVATTAETEGTDGHPEDTKVAEVVVITGTKKAEIEEDGTSEAAEHQGQAARKEEEETGANAEETETGADHHADKNAVEVLPRETWATREDPLLHTAEKRRDRTAPEELPWIANTLRSTINPRTTV